MVLSDAVSPLLWLISAPAAAGEDASASQWLPAMLMSVGIVIVLVLWTMSMRGRAARKHADYITPREQIERIKAAHRSREAESTLSADFVTSATELAARLDNKAERLEQLLEQADERIAYLQQLATQFAAPPGHAIERDEPNPSPPPAPTDPLLRAVCELADSGCTPVEIAQQLDEQVGKIELILALRQQ